MIEFIICDDNKIICEQVRDVVNKIMMKNNHAYNVHLFNDYDIHFLNLIKTKSQNRIYFLDIEMISLSGITAALMIRKTDVNAVIIFLTSHNELGSILLDNELMFLTFICKYDDYIKKIASATEKALEVVGKNTVIRFEDKSTVYTIPLKDILYIYRDSVERRCIIKTNYSEFKINKTLSGISELLDFNFIKTHRACIVNMKRVIKYDLKTNELLFDDGNKTNLIAPNFRKEVKGYVAS